MLRAVDSCYTIIADIDAFCKYDKLILRGNDVKASGSCFFAYSKLIADTLLDIHAEFTLCSDFTVDTGTRVCYNMNISKLLSKLTILQVYK